MGGETLVRILRHKGTRVMATGLHCQKPSRPLSLPLTLLVIRYVCFFPPQCSSSSSPFSFFSHVLPLHSYFHCLHHCQYLHSMLLWTISPLSSSPLNHIHIHKFTIKYSCVLTSGSEQKNEGHQWNGK